MKRVNKKTLKDLTTLMLLCFVSSLAFFVVMNTLDMITNDTVARSIISIILFSADMLFLALFMSCIYGIKALHEDLDITWRLLFFRIVLIFAAMTASELKFLPELEDSRKLMQSCAYLMENASLLCFVIAYRVMINCFAYHLEKIGNEKKADKCRKGATLYLSIGISAVLFGVASVFVPGEGKTVIMAGVINTAVFVMRLIVIFLDIPIYLATRDARGTIWRIRLERAQEGRHIR